MVEVSFRFLLSLFPTFLSFALYLFLSLSFPSSPHTRPATVMAVPPLASDLSSATVSGYTALRPGDNNTHPPHDEYHVVLLSIYTLGLLIGIPCLALTVRVLQFASHSLTTIAVHNLVFAHFLFLVTLPFRIYYYANGEWHLGNGLCKAVSSMIHVHLYMSFICYVVILVTRLLAFHKRTNQMEFHRRTHALLGSLAIWVVAMVLVTLAIVFCYGNEAARFAGDTRYANNTCFEFGREIKAGAKAVNYVGSLGIIGVSVVLTGLQAQVLLVLYREHGRSCISQQMFGTQLKSLCFALIMMVCFVPYHVFRLYYISNLSCQHINEVFLSLTTFNCLDMLTFMRKGTWLWCYK